MGTLVMILQLILSLSILVTLHELGHYIAARAFGIKVEKFFIFFDAWGFKLFKIKKGDTEYGIGWLPLGGYVKIAGMIDESMDREQLKKPAQNYEFRSKPAWQRLIVMVSGVLMNVIVGILIFSFNILSFEKAYLPIEEVNKTGIHVSEMAQKIGFETGDKLLKINDKDIVRWNDAAGINIYFGAKMTVERNNDLLDIVIPDTTYKSFKKARRPLFELSNFPNIIDSLVPNKNAQKAGLKVGDQLIGINEVSTPNFGTFLDEIKQHKNQEINLKYIRNQKEDSIIISVSKQGTLGFAVAQPQWKTHPYSIAEAFKFGTSDAFGFLWSNIKGIGEIINGRENASEAIQGPIGMATMFGKIWNWQRFWTLTGFISMILAFMNILPIPALDGGHAMFTIYEMIVGKKPSDKFLEHAQILGMLILFSLMIFAFGNDIYKNFLN